MLARCIFLSKIIRKYLEFYKFVLFSMIFFSVDLNHTRCSPLSAYLMDLIIKKEFLLDDVLKDINFSLGFNINILRIWQFLTICKLIMTVLSCWYFCCPQHLSSSKESSLRNRNVTFHVVDLRYFYIILVKLHGILAFFQIY